MNILTVNLLFSTLVFWSAARLYVLPKLQEYEPRIILLPILLLHAMRHLGLMFLAPGATYPGMPPQFAYPAAFGDLLASMLALIAIPAVATQARSAKLLVWLFNIEGTLDLIDAIALATIHEAAPFMGPAYSSANFEYVEMPSEDARPDERGENPTQSTLDSARSQITSARIAHRSLGPAPCIRSPIVLRSKTQVEFLILISPSAVTRAHSTPRYMASDE